MAGGLHKGTLIPVRFNVGTCLQTGEQRETNEMVSTDELKRLATADIKRRFWLFALQAALAGNDAKINKKRG